MSLGVAFRAFFKALFDRQAAGRIRQALESSAGPAEEDRPVTKAVEQAPSRKPAAVPAARSDALTLLSTLQREARLLDLVEESLDGYEDAQIGAAAREVLKDTRQTLDRLFAIAPLAEQDEGEPVEIDRDSSPHRVRLVGKSQGSSGTIAHRGWKATKCELPKWNGKSGEALLLAPTEIEVQ